MLPSVFPSVKPYNDLIYVLLNATSSSPSGATSLLPSILPLRKPSLEPSLLTSSVVSTDQSQYPSNKTSTLSYLAPSVEHYEHPIYIKTYLPSISPSRSPRENLLRYGLYPFIMMILYNFGLRTHETF